MKKILSGFLTVLFLLCLIQCSSPEAEKEKSDVSVMNRYFRTKIKSIDPVKTDDRYSSYLVGAIYQTLYEYHYLKRPYELKPALAAAMPEISEDGLVYTIKIKEGVKFADNPCFPEGKGRVVTAADVVFSYKRIADLNTKSSGWWIFNGRIKGMNEFRDLSAGSPNPYDLDIEGLSALDDYILQITLTEPLPQFNYLLAMSFTAIVPKEALNYYEDGIGRNAAGSGPYVLADWSQSNKIILERNPNYMTDLYPEDGAPGDAGKGLLDDAGEKMPFVDRVIYTVYIEAQPSWFEFMNGNIDIYTVPKDYYNVAINSDGELTQQFKDLNVTLHKDTVLDLTYLGFNMEDPVIGKNVHLRRAIAYAYDVNYAIKNFYNNRAVRAQSPLPMGVFGAKEDWDNPWIQISLEKASKELALAGYPEGEGAPVLQYDSAGQSSASTDFADLFVRCMNKIGLEVEVNSHSFPQYLARLRNKQAQIFGSAWGADYPDPENFLQLFYGKNVSPGSNAFNYANEEYDELYKKMVLLPDGNDREEVISEMVHILIEDVPCVFCTHRTSSGLAYPWVKNLKLHEMANSTLKYIRIDAQLKEQ